jgi:toxin ParE1/3/4
MKPPFNLSIAPLARADLRTVRRTSQLMWGVEQSDQYTTQLENALNTLIEFPNLGRPFSDLRLGMRGLKVGQHMIYYFVDENSIRVARILHSRMDAAAQFES